MWRARATTSARRVVEPSSEGTLFKTNVRSRRTVVQQRCITLRSRRNARVARARNFACLRPRRGPEAT